MSGTRSRSPKEPVTEALIVAHGQPSAPEPPEEALAHLAGQIGMRLPGWRIRSATLAMPDRLEQVTAEMPDGAVVYPFFMAKGWFVDRVLPRRLGDHGFRIANPLGLDPGLPVVAAQTLRIAAQERGLADGFEVLLAAHGSGRGTAAAEAAHGFADRLGAYLTGVEIRTGFVEQDPTIAAAATGMGATTLCLPFFAFPGDHYQEDIPQALAEAGFGGALLPVLGLDAQVPDLIAAAIRRTASEDLG